MQHTFNTTAITAQLDQTRFDTNQVSTHLTTITDFATNTEHPEWSPGKPCPNCSETILARFVTHTEIAQHTNGTSVFEDSSRQYTPLLWWCETCDTILDVSPAIFIEPDNYPIPHPPQDAHEALTAILETITPTVPWSPGTPCTHCDHPYIGEQHVDLEWVTSTDGEIVSQNTGDRIQTVSYWCDSCGENLHDSPLGVAIRYSKTD